MSDKVIIYSLEEENFHKKIGNSEIFPDDITIIYKGVDANPLSFIFEAMENSADFMFFVGNQQLLNFNLVETGIQKLKTYPASFVYSDGYLVGEHKQPLMLPTYKPNMLAQNRMVINIPLLVKRNIKFNYKLNEKALDKIQQLPLFFLLKLLTEFSIGYHLVQPTYNIFNFTSSIQEELKVIGI